MVIPPVRGGELFKIGTLEGGFVQERPVDVSEHAETVQLVENGDAVDFPHRGALAGLEERVR
jgi:hypothetical protein